MFKWLSRILFGQHKFTEPTQKPKESSSYKSNYRPPTRYPAAPKGTTSRSNCKSGRCRPPRRQDDPSDVGSFVYGALYGSTLDNDSSRSQPKQHHVDTPAPTYDHTPVERSYSTTQPSHDTHDSSSSSSDSGSSGGDSGGCGGGGGGD